MMIAEGVMDNPKVDAIFGLHIASELPVGKIQYKSGAVMAAADWLTIKVKGKGSHGSQPWLGVDPIAISAQIIQGLQNIVSRQSDLVTGPVVITIGKIQGGVRENIISEECTMAGTIRTLDAKMQEQVHAQIKKVATKIAEANGATAEVIIDTKTLVTYNEPALLEKILPALQKTLGTENVVPGLWETGAEDFSYFGTKAPAVFLFVGGLAKGADPATAPPHHTADFRVEDESMKTGIQAFCAIIADYLKLK
ncbi:MAG: amidohydrolase [Chitinophagaceae bacterium]|nr:amidohydrolase [Chitinophagaceae bacterium]